MKYIPRVLNKTIARYLKLFPVVGLTGPRQSGKTTLLKKIAGKKYSYITFDDYSMVEFFHRDPQKFIHTYSRNIIFDEVQKVPELFHYVKRTVDENRDKYGQYILSGSSRFGMIKGISETLAGRIGLVSLLPFEYSETPVSLRTGTMLGGSFPELVGRKFMGADEWYSSYIETYVSRDLQQLVNIGDLRNFRNFITLLAGRVSQVLNVSGLSRDLGTPVSTLKRWLSVLEASYIIFLLPPYFKNFGKRIIKAPKIHFYDTGMVAFLTGTRTLDQYHKGPLAGYLFENFIVSEFVKSMHHKGIHDDVYYLRTSHGDEIDLVVDKKTCLELIEVKKSETFRPQMIDKLNLLRGEKDNAILVYEGKKLPDVDGCKILNYKEFLGRRL